MRNSKPGFAILRIRKDLLGWDGLSDEQRAVAIVVQKVIADADGATAEQEADRLNRLSRDSDTVYISLYARIVDSAEDGSE